MRRKSLRLLPFLLLTTSCAAASLSSNLAVESSSPKHSKDSAYVDYECVFDESLNIANPFPYASSKEPFTLDKFPNISFSWTTSPGYHYFCEANINGKTLRFNKSLYIADVNNDGHEDLLLCVFHAVGYSGDYDVFNQSTIYDYYNDEILYDSEHHEDGLSSIITEKDGELVIQEGSIYSGFEIKKQKYGRFLKSGEKKYQVEWNSYPFSLLYIYLKEMGTPYEPLNKFEAGFAGIINSFDTFRFDVVLGHEGVVEDNPYAGDKIKFECDVLKSATFVKYESGVYSYDLTFREKEKGRYRLTASLGNESSYMNLSLDDENSLVWAKNRTKVKDLFKGATDIKLSDIVSVEYSAYSVEGKKRKNNISSSNQEDISSLFALLDNPITLVDGNSQFSTKSWVTYSLSSKETTIEFEDDRISFYGLSYSFNNEIEINNPESTSWSFIDSDDNGSPVKIYNRSINRATVTMRDMDKIKFSSWPENRTHPTIPYNYYLNFDGQRVEVYTENEVKVDDEWFLITSDKNFSCCF